MSNKGIGIAFSDAFPYHASSQDFWTLPSQVAGQIWARGQDDQLITQICTIESA